MVQQLLQLYSKSFCQFLHRNTKRKYFFETEKNESLYADSEACLIHLQPLGACLMHICRQNATLRHLIFRYLTMKGQIIYYSTRRLLKFHMFLNKLTLLATKRPTLKYTNLFQNDKIERTFQYKMNNFVEIKCFKALL